MFDLYFRTSGKLARVLAATFCLALIGCSRSQNYHGVTIYGSEEFADQVQRALELIRTQSPDDFESISKYVRRIEESDRSGMVIVRNACQLAPSAAYHSLTWCAGCIAHEAHHAMLSQSSTYSYGHAEEEQVCIAYQQAVMERIGAPASELEYLASLDGSHFDADGDGRYTWDDYEARDW